MPRKKSVSGRARVASAENRLQLQVEKLNRRIRSLEKRGNFGVYAGKSFLEFASRSKFVSVKKARGSKRHRVVLKKLQQATFGQLKEIHKKFKHFLQSKTFTNIGIEAVRAETKRKVKDYFAGALDRPVSDSDLEKFYEVNKYSSDKIIEMIGPSEFTIMVFEARDTNAGVDRWVEMIIEHGVTVNNDYTRNQCVELYNKFVR